MIPKKIMNAIPTLRSFLSPILVLFPAFLGAATLPSLNEEEQKLVNRGEVIGREVPTDAQAGRTFEAIGLIDASRATVVRVLTTMKGILNSCPTSAVQTWSNDMAMRPLSTTH
jgi:hypothetical protein